MAGEPSLGEIVAGFVEGTIVGITRAFTERPGQAILTNDDIFVRRVSDHTSKDMEDAYLLLEKEHRIASDEKRSREDMMRFVKDSNERGWFRHRKFRDHLLVARSADHVEAMAFFTHYPRDRKCAVSYFIARRSGKQPGVDRPSHSMASALATYLKSLRPRVGLMVAEVDDPRLTSSPPERNKRSARIKVFMDMAEVQGQRLHVVDFPYVQPSMDPNSRDGERQMLLIVIPLRAPREQNHMTGDELSVILRWLYGRVYADSYISKKKFDAPYRAQLAELQAEQLTAISTRADAIPCPDAEPWLKAVRTSAAASV